VWIEVLAPKTTSPSLGLPRGDLVWISPENDLARRNGRECVKPDPVHGILTPSRSRGPILDVSIAVASLSEGSFSFDPVGVIRSGNLEMPRSASERFFLGVNL
jgi:hypothetical protein